MDDFDDDGDNTFINYTLDMSMCRLIDNIMLPTKLTLNLGIDMLTDDDAEVQFAINKVHHWIEHHVSRSIAVSSQNAAGFDLLLNPQGTPRLDNALMITVEEPSDHHLMFIFQSKIEAIADGAFIVSSIEIKSDNALGLKFTYIGDGNDALPEMDEWIPGPNWFTTPWWNRNDVSMIDTVAPEGTDLSVIPAWASGLDFLKPEQNDNSAVVIRGDWEPRIVDDKTKK